MKRIIIYFIGFVLFISITSFVIPNKTKYLAKYGFRKIPSGELFSENATKNISSFYIFETEVTNRQYAEFLHDLLSKNRLDDYNKCKIDSLGWNKALHFDNSYPKDYHLTAEFAEYPVVNISYEAAELFCTWLENKLERKINTIEIRLPTAEEWEYAAKGGKQNAVYPWENIATGNKKDFELCNYNSPVDGTCLATNYAKSYFANAYGLYNMSGNVAEMLQEKGNTKGGSWNSTFLEMKIDAKDEYKSMETPSPFIGFRPVAIIK